jgi:hypothetical protein
MCIDALFVSLNSLVKCFLPALCSFYKRLEAPSAIVERRPKSVFQDTVDKRAIMLDAIWF